MKNEMNLLPLLSDCNGHAVRVGVERPHRQLGDAVRNVHTGKVFRVAKLHGGLVTLTNANGSKPSCPSERFCLETDFASRYVFDCAAW